MNIEYTLSEPDKLSGICELYIKLCVEEDSIQKHRFDEDGVFRARRGDEVLEFVENNQVMNAYSLMGDVQRLISSTFDNDVRMKKEGKRTDIEGWFYFRAGDLDKQQLRRYLSDIETNVSKISQADHHDNDWNLQMYI